MPSFPNRAKTRLHFRTNKPKQAFQPQNPNAPNAPPLHFQIRVQRSVLYFLGLRFTSTSSLPSPFRSFSLLQASFSPVFRRRECAGTGSRRRSPSGASMRAFPVPVSRSEEPYTPEIVSLNDRRPLPPSRRSGPDLLPFSWPRRAADRYRWRHLHAVE